MRRVWHSYRTCKLRGSASIGSTRFESAIHHCGDKLYLSRLAWGHVWHWPSRVSTKPCFCRLGHQNQRFWILLETFFWNWAEICSSFHLFRSAFWSPVTALQRLGTGTVSFSLSSLVSGPYIADYHSFHRGEVPSVTVCQYSHFLIKEVLRTWNENPGVVYSVWKWVGQPGPDGILFYWCI